MTPTTALALMSRANVIAAVCKNVQVKNKSASVYSLYGQRPFATDNSATKVAQEQPTESTVDTAELSKKLSAELEVLGSQVTDLKKQNEELTDKYKRSLADSENLRLRLNKQIADAKIFGIQSFCKDLLEVADTLGHATSAVPQTELNEKNPHLQNLYQGLTMTQASLLQVFKRHGLEPMNPLNEKFNPNLHEALFQKEDANVEPDTVIEVTKLGYKLHERCIRPALVGVSKRS